LQAPCRLPHSSRSAELLSNIRKAIKSALYPLYEWRIVKDLDFSKTPRHVGVILDGNRRFAKENPSPLDPKGHRRGASKIVEFLGWCDEAKVEAYFELLAKP
jgi:short-chain Z-isoprenyl diphosphate synthase